MRRFWAVFKKEFRQIGRDPLSLGVLILVPAFLLVIYGYALSFDVKHIRVGVLDLDRTQESRAFLDSLFQNPYFDRVRTLSRIQEADDLLNRGRVRAVLAVPRGYARGLSRGETVKVQFLVDGSDANAALTAVGYMDALTDRATRKLRADALGKAGVPAALPFVVPEPRIWFNPELISARFLVPGLIGMLLMLSAVVATSMSIVREKERETMEQMMVSPLRPEELILGKLLPYVFICLVTMTIILILGYVLFGVVVRGSFFLLGLATLLFLFAALGMGVLISSVTKSQRVAFEIAIITSLLPSVILSGLIFPIKNMPVPIQALTVVVIPRYFVAALREIILKGAALHDLWPQLGGMLALGILFNILAAHNTRKSI
ncbi:MAG: ABC transporter permease [Verrucomicrobiota bacterium]